jgi:Arc/MetJ-type ribon-helix-helix transcriptional regulator
MAVVQLPDELKRVIDHQVAEGRVATEAEFLAEAIRRYADALASDEDNVMAAADEGIADMEAGRFEAIAGRDDRQRLRAELRESRDAAERGAARR